MLHHSFFLIPNLTLPWCNQFPLACLWARSPTPPAFRALFRELKESLTGWGWLEISFSLFACARAAGGALPIPCLFWHGSLCFPAAGLGGFLRGLQPPRHEQQPWPWVTPQDSPAGRAAPLPALISATKQGLCKKWGLCMWGCAP